MLSVAFEILSVSAPQSGAKPGPQAGPDAVTSFAAMLDLETLQQDTAPKTLEGALAALLSQAAPTPTEGIAPASDLVPNIAPDQAAAPVVATAVPALPNVESAPADSKPVDVDLQSDDNDEVDATAVAPDMIAVVTAIAADSVAPARPADQIPADKDSAEPVPDPESVPQTAKIADAVAVAITPAAANTPHADGPAPQDEDQATAVVARDARPVVVKDEIDATIDDTAGTGAKDQPATPKADPKAEAAAPAKPAIAPADNIKAQQTQTEPVEGAPVAAPPKAAQDTPAPANSAPAHANSAPAQRDLKPQHDGAPALKATSDQPQLFVLPQAGNAAASDRTAPAASSPQAVALPVAGIAVEIASKALEGKNRFEIRLDPPELGRIHVRLDVDRNGEITSHVMTDRHDTLDLLRRDAPALERALQDAGLKTSSNGLQFSLRDHGSGQQGRPIPMNEQARLVIADDSLAVETIAPVYRTFAGNRAGVDIRV